MYLKQRKAYKQAQALHDSIDKNSTGSGNKSASQSCGRLQTAREVSAGSNPKSRNFDKVMSSLGDNKVSKTHN